MASLKENWGNFAGLTACGLFTLLFALWLATRDPPQILVQGKWMDRSEVIVRSDEIIARAGAISAKRDDELVAEFRGLQDAVNEFCKDNAGDNSD